MLSDFIDQIQGSREAALRGFLVPAEGLLLLFISVQP